jgi:hypothetical protein
VDLSRPSRLPSALSPPGSRRLAAPRSPGRRHRTEPSARPPRRHHGRASRERHAIRDRRGLRPGDSRGVPRRRSGGDAPFLRRALLHLRALGPAAPRGPGLLPARRPGPRARATQRGRRSAEREAPRGPGAGRRGDEGVRGRRLVGTHPGHPALLRLGHLAVRRRRGGVPRPGGQPARRLRAAPRGSAAAAAGPLLRRRAHSGHPLERGANLGRAGAARDERGHGPVALATPRQSSYHAGSGTRVHPSASIVGPVVLQTTPRSGRGDRHRTRRHRQGESGGGRGDRRPERRRTGPGRAFGNHAPAPRLSRGLGARRDRLGERRSVGRPGGRVRLGDDTARPLCRHAATIALPERQAGDRRHGGRPGPGAPGAPGAAPRGPDQARVERADPLRPREGGDGGTPLPLLEVPHHDPRGRPAAAEALADEPDGRPPVQGRKGPAPHAHGPIPVRHQPRRDPPAVERHGRGDEPRGPSALAFPGEPGLRPLARGAVVGAPGRHGTVADLPPRPRQGRLPPVDLLRPALRPEPVPVAGHQDPRSHPLSFVRSGYIRSAGCSRPASAGSGGPRGARTSASSPPGTRRRDQGRRGAVCRARSAAPCPASQGRG